MLKNWLKPKNMELKNQYFGNAAKFGGSEAIWPVSSLVFRGPERS